MYATESQESNVIQGKFTAEQYSEMEAIADKTPKANLKYANMPIQLTAHGIMQEFREGDITPAEYAKRALQISRIGAEQLETLDVFKFIDDWAVETIDGGGEVKLDKYGDPKLKKLNADVVYKIIMKKMKGGTATVETTTQVQLDWNL